MTYASVYVSFAAGLFIGSFFFLGLWLTIRKIGSLGAPGLWLFLSFLARSGVALTALYVVTQGKWENLLMGLAGFLLARWCLIKRLGPPAAASAGKIK